ncbi:MAG: neutral/alkaline non-lysosomal ceramidase N-terminal domain-containing protein [Archangium sp.]
MKSSWSLLALCFTLSACPPPPPPPPAKPGPLRAGVATVKLDQPVGMAMGGYLRQRPGSDPGSTWAKQFPASRGVHTEPTARTLALTNGLSRVALVRLDLTIVSPTLRTRIRNALAAAGETANVLLYATHTHAGPARFMPPAHLGDPNGTDFVALVMDHYDTEAELRLVNAIMASIAQAFASLEPVSYGIATVDASAFNNDRRCENDPIYGYDFRDTNATVIRFDVVDESGNPVRPLTALVHYAMHGTVLGEQNTLQSTEGPGAMELYASDALGVPVVYVQGAAGDVSPKGSPFGHDDLQNLERQGKAAAKLISDAYARAAPAKAGTEVRLDFRERGILIDRAAIGYAQGEFPESGGLQCAAGGPGPCGAVVSTPSQVLCLPLERRRAFRSSLSMVRLGEDLIFFSLPGEPGTGLTRKMETSLAGFGAQYTLPVGYAQDHFGYLLEEDDWLRGGYEPTVSAFGWKFGPYLLSELETFAATIDETQPAVDAMPLPETPPHAVTDSPRVAATVTEPMDAERLQTHTFVFEGGDPTLGLPQVSLEKKEGTAFVQVMASPTRPLINGPELMIRYAATPTWAADQTATSRTHAWSVFFETVPSTALGEYRFVARGKVQRAGAAESYELISRTFTVSKATSATASVKLVSDKLALDGRFPPNPTIRASDIDDPIGHFRMFDDDANPRNGAHVHPASGATLMAEVRAPDMSTSMQSFAWSESDAAWISATALTQSGSYQVTVAAGALRDVNGNENGAVVVGAVNH